MNCAGLQVVLQCYYCEASRTQVPNFFKKFSFDTIRGQRCYIREQQNQPYGGGVCVAWKIQDKMSST